MKDQWYGDNRDLIKWGVLLRLAEHYSADQIIQIAYWRQTFWPTLKIDGLEHDIPQPVLRHFRNVRNATGLSNRPRIQVFDVPIHSRKVYLAKLLLLISIPHGQRSVLFLDPDTGLASGSPGLQHVLDQEVSAIWAKMPINDVLAFYQHKTNRNANPWVEAKHHQFAAALGLSTNTVKFAYGHKIARDVVIFYAQKTKVPDNIG